ncbi:MAG TPA: pyrroline-5-carboxylate reductase dimerization domain-containing protein [Aliidongia sp.]|nr:pyrroline-5-carboxylate reductase dimerization domain-containing protein [Aliidongia sp.]
MRIGVIGGGGWLGGAIVRSILKAKLTSPQRLTLSSRRDPPPDFPGVVWTRDNQDLVDHSDVVIVSVRPADWPALTIVAGDKLVLSVMAGIRLAQLSEQFKAERVVRALPNAAAEVGKSYTPWVASAGVNDLDRSVVRSIFDACGIQDEVANEADIDYLTGLSGSGPAFPALLAAVMIEDAVAHGIARHIARRSATATMVGAGYLFEQIGEEPAETVDRFVAYGGTTAAAIEAMRSRGFDAAVSAGLAAALKKSVGLGHGS